MRFGRIISLRSRVIGRSRCHHRPAVFWKEIESFYAREGDDVKPVLLVLKPNHRRHPTQLQLWTCYRRIICSALAELLPTYTETVRRSRESNYMGVFFSLWRSTTEYETDGRSTYLMEALVAVLICTADVVLEMWTLTAVNESIAYI